MAWKTVSRLKKTKIFKDKGDIYLPSMSNGVGWKDSNIISFLTSISKIGNGLSHDVVVYKNNDNSYNIHTNKTVFSQSKVSNFTLREYRRRGNSINADIAQDYYSSGDSSCIFGTLFIDFERIYYSGIGWSIIPAYDFSFDLYVGGVFQGKYHKRFREYIGHEVISYPYNVAFGDTKEDMNRSTATICNIIMPNTYENGNVELRNFSFTYSKDEGDPSLLECDYKVVLYSYTCDKLTTSISDSQCLSMAYEVN